MVEWTLQISTKDNKNQEQVNSYAKELNKVYKFEERLSAAIRHSPMRWLRSSPNLRLRLKRNSMRTA